MNQEVRTISYLLHPPLLDEAGLASAVRWFIDGFAQRSKIRVDLDLPVDSGGSRPRLETAIFGLYRSAFTQYSPTFRKFNCKDSPSSSRRSGGCPSGGRRQGNPPEKREAMVSAGTPGVGIRGMRERIRQLGGALEIYLERRRLLWVLARLPAIVNSSSEDVSPISETSTTAA